MECLKRNCHNEKIRKYLSQGHLYKYVELHLFDYIFESETNLWVLSTNSDYHNHVKQWDVIIHPCPNTVFGAGFENNLSVGQVAQKIHLSWCCPKLSQI